MIGIRPPTESSDFSILRVDTVDSVDHVRNRRRRVIEETRASLGELRFQRARMHNAMSSMRNEIELARALREGVRPGPPSIPISNRRTSLSHREVEVLKLVAAGLPNKQIAVRLGISERTVRNHMTEVFTRLRVHNRTEAVLKALRSGLSIV